MKPDYEEAKSKLLQGNRQKLQRLRADAKRGFKLRSTSDRLKAAYRLRQAWERANKSGMRKEDFQRIVHEKLERKRQSSEEFRLQNWILKRGEDPLTQDLSGRYRGKSVPQQALEPYLVAIAVAAEHCNASPEDWQIEMLRDLSLWSQSSSEATPEIEPDKERPLETLAVLLNALCKRLAEVKRLGDVLDAIRATNCHWDRMRNVLVPMSDMVMEDPKCPVDEGLAIYFEEALPYPTVPLLVIPYMVAEACFRLAPEAAMRPVDAILMSQGRYLSLGFAGDGSPEMGRHYNIPDNAPKMSELDGTLYWSRELRLAIVPDGNGNFKAALETRPLVEVEFAADTAFAGRHVVVGAIDPLLQRAHFYARAEDGGHVWPHIHDADGKQWRITALEGEKRHYVEREVTGWQFDGDPINAPKWVWHEPWETSWTDASPAYLRHWLQNDWSLGLQFPWCPFDQIRLGVDQERWERGLPPLQFLCFPMPCIARTIECCLHNDLILEKLSEEIDCLKTQAADWQSRWITEREKNVNTLLRRWNSSLGQESREG